MDYDFDPHQTREALAALAAAFPLKPKRAPLGLSMLFQLLAQMDLKTLGTWSKRLTGRELDLLCQYYKRTSESGTVLAIALVLAHRRDPRFKGVLRYFFHLLPPDTEFVSLKEHWSLMGLDEAMTGEASWMTRYLELARQPPLVGFLISELERNGLGLDDIIADFVETTPLIDSIMAYVFTTGGVFLKQLRPERVAVLAQTYLEEGQDLQVQTYLNHIHDSDLKPEFLDLLYQLKGPPEPRTYRFYRAIEKGRIWGIRKRMFETRVGDTPLPARKQDFWQRWIHKCHNWEWIDEAAHISIHPFKIVEEQDRTLVYMLSDRRKLVEMMDFDHHWVEKIEALLSEYLDWGYYT